MSETLHDVTEVWTVALGELHGEHWKHHIKQEILRCINPGPVPLPMASSSNIDIEGATQHLRDILKLDRSGTGM